MAGSTFPCSATGPGSVQYDACHALEIETILQLRAEIEQLLEALRNVELILQVPAGEYVPAIRDALDVIEKILKRRVV